MIKHWLHETNLSIQLNKTSRMPWIRKVTARGPLRWMQDSNDLADGFIEILVSGLIEKPGLPPIMGIAAEVWQDDGVSADGDRANEIEYTVYYYGAMEFYADTSVLPGEPDVPLHAEEEIASTPIWILPPDPEAETEDQGE